ncbi:MAG: response regulator, partial [Acidobacteriaceae bacterium]|nr:response regulator [Acidobacteriaceae bacterium]
MTSEQNVPEVQSCQDSMGETAQQDNDAATNGQSGPNGMGQSKSSRRRRRKRRSKGIDASSGQLGFENQPEVQIQASQAPQPSGGQPNYGGAQQQQQGPGGKRWKKKFRRGQHAGGSGAESGYRGSDTHQPGNTTHRRGKGGKQQKAQRGFVGPMDHSYREVNGNFADAPPSTIETGNYARNGHGSSRAVFYSDSGPIDYSVGRAIPIDENAPVRIYF